MNAVALALLLLAGRLQDEAETHTIPKQERSIYVPARQKFFDAEQLLLKDPSECAKRCIDPLIRFPIASFKQSVLLMPPTICSALDSAPMKSPIS